MPAVAVSPGIGSRGSYSDGSATSENGRKTSDDYSRKHLADVQEEGDEGSEGSINFSQSDSSDRFSPRERKPSTCSTFSLSSMDALWEHHPRRLSEAGLRRTSDHSVVLTEDTDSFIIGERVYVGGNKPGQIAYIGDTQFAPGEWAGVVLDEAIGKNDGSVAGVRYFQCESRRGVFSRLTRLTRDPLMAPSPLNSPLPISPTASDRLPPPSPGERLETARKMNLTLSSPRSKMPRSSSPNGSVMSMSSRMSEMINPAYGFCSSTISPADVRLGDRVIVSSSQGSKAGILRFMGPTDFAAGLWCGVELDDPMGKNDGSVEGKRYFECGPRFGLFAPASKVSRSPSNARRPGSCAVHGSRVSSPPGSVISMTSSIGSVRQLPRLGVTALGGAGQRLSGPRASSTPMSAKNTLQELLREKQQHIERLIKEQEVERGELAKMSLQYKWIENAATNLKKENAEYRKDIEKMNADYVEVSQQLEDEKQKGEDLMFRAEEDNIHKEDFTKFKEELTTEKIKLSTSVADLEKQLEVSRKQVQELEAQCVISEAQHKAQNEIVFGEHKDELQASQALAAELQKLLDEAHVLLREKDGDKESLGKNHTEEVMKIKSDSEKIISELKTKLSEVQLDASVQISAFTEKLNEAEKHILQQNERLQNMELDHNNVLSEIRSKLEKTQVSLEVRTQEYNQSLASAKESELSHKKDLEKLKMELSAKILDSETSTDSNKQLESVIANLRKELEAVKLLLANKGSELEDLSNVSAKQNESIQNEMKEMQEKFINKEKELTELSAKSSEAQKVFEKSSNDQSDRLKTEAQEILTLKSEIEKLKEQFAHQTETLQTDFAKKMEESDLKLKSATKQLEEQVSAVEETNKQKQNIENESSQHQTQIKSLIEVHAQAQQRLEEISKSNSEVLTKLGSLELENGDLVRQIRNESEKYAELQQQKEKLENEISQLNNHSTSSDEQLTTLTNKLRDSERELQLIKEANREKISTFERGKQESGQLLEQTRNELAAEKNSLAESLKQIVDSKKQHEEQLRGLNQKISEIEGNLTGKLTETESKYKTEMEKLQHELESKNTQEAVLKAHIEEVEQASIKTINDLNTQLENLQVNGSTSELKLKEKLDQLIATQNELNHKLETSQQNEKSLQDAHQKISDEYSKLKAFAENQLKSKEEHGNSVENELQKVKGDYLCLVQSHTANEAIIKEMNLQSSLLQVELKSNVEIISEKDRQINSHNIDLKKALEEKHDFEKKLNNITNEYESVTKNFNAIKEDLTLKETVAQEQTKVISQLKEEIGKINQEKISTESATFESHGKINTLTAEIGGLTEKIVNFEKTVSDLNSQIKARDEKLSKVENDMEKLETFQYETNVLKEEVQQNLTELKNKNALIFELNTTIESLKKINTGSSEIEEKCKSLDTELLAIKVSHLQEINELKKLLKNMETESKELEKKASQCDEANQKCTDLKCLVEKSEADLKSFTLINEAQKTNYEQLNKQLQEQHDTLRSESKKERKQFKAQIEAYETRRSEKKKQFETLENERTETRVKLEEAESSVVELKNKISYLEASSNKKADEEQTELQKVVLELQNTKKTHSEESKVLKTELSKLNEQITKKETDAHKYGEQLTIFENDLKNYKSQNKTLSEELVKLNAELKQYKNVSPAVKINGSDVNKNVPESPQNGSDTKRLLEEKEEVEGQVNFLNSVIVDMQKKNEELKARVEVLEMGCTPQEADEYNLNGLKAKIAAPRMFCDICDIFDAHETEDCPRQTSDADVMAVGDKKTPPAQRSYCDICEIFGHATEDCDDEETY